MGKSRSNWSQEKVVSGLLRSMGGAPAATTYRDCLVDEILDEMN